MEVYRTSSNMSSMYGKVAARIVPPSLAARSEADRSELPIRTKRSRPPKFRDRFPIRRRLVPILGPEVCQFARFVKRKLGSNRVASVGERCARGSMVDGFPLNRGIDQRRRRHDAHVIEHRDGFAFVHFWSRDVDDSTPEPLL